MKKRTIIIGVLISVSHFVVTAGAILVTFGKVMNSFENADYQPSAIESAAESLADILTQPGASLWTSWMSTHMPDAVEWIIAGANSLVWGMLIALLLNVPTHLIRKSDELKEELE